MAMRVKTPSSTPTIPENLRSLFWDCDFESLDLDENRNFVIRRILDRGDWPAICWMRCTLGDDAVRQWFAAKHGGGLDPRKLRFWELILDLPKPDVDEWVRQARTSTWYGRAA